jgi:hypothetical protein
VLAFAAVCHDDPHLLRLACFVEDIPDLLSVLGVTDVSHVSLVPVQYMLEDLQESVVRRLPVLSRCGILHSERNLALSSFKQTEMPSR